MPQRPKTLIFPVGGLNRRFAYQAQPPFTCADALNVRSDGAVEGRARGGSRPGMVKAFGERVSCLGSGTVTGLTVATPPSYTTVTTAAATFAATEALALGQYVTFEASGNRYPIVLWTSTTVVAVQGDATGEVLATGTVSGIIKEGTDSEITVATEVLEGGFAGKSFKFDNGSAYPITYVESTTVLNVTGDASGESPTDTFTIYDTVTVVSKPPCLVSQIREITAAGGSFWRDNFPDTESTVTGTVTDVTIDNGTTQVTIATAEPDLFDLVGNYFTFNSSGVGYPISSVDSATVLHLTGDATGESDTDTFTIRRIALGGVWSLPAGYTALPWVNPANDMATGWYNQNARYYGAVRDRLSPDYDTSGLLSIEIAMHPNSQEWGMTYELVAGYDLTDPDVDEDSIVAACVISAGGYVTGTLKVTVGGSTVTQANFSLTLQNYLRTPVPFRMTVNGADHTVKVYVNGVEKVDYTLSAAAPAEQALEANTRFGFALQGNDPDAGPGTEPQWARTDHFTASYVPASGPVENRMRLVAAGESPNEAAGAAIFVEDNQGIMVENTGATCSLNADVNLQASALGGKLYIADVDAVSPGAASDGVITTGTNVMTSATIGDWTDHCNVNDHVVVITGMGASAHITPGTYVIKSIATTDLELDRAADDGTGDTDVIFHLERALKVYDPVAGSLELVVPKAVAYAIPDSCPIVCTYRNRLAHGGDRYAPHQWYMSAMGDPTDYEYATTAATGAISGVQADCGQLPDPLRALVPFGSDYLIFLCDRSTWRLLGDPFWSGEYDALSRSVGIVSKNAWCRTPEMSLYWLGRGGLYRLPPGASAFPEPVSPMALPRELLNPDEGSLEISLAYEHRDRGIHIFLTPKERTNSGSHWWYDEFTGGFWPVGVTTSCEPHAVVEYQADLAANSGVIVGCRDGYLRRFDHNAEDDDGDSFTSRVLIGPLRLGSNDWSRGLVESLIAVLGESSGNVTWSVFVGDTAEAAYKSYSDVTILGSGSAFATGTWIAGRNYTVRPQAGGYAAYLLLSASGVAWAMEQVVAMFEQLGEVRKA